MFKEQCSWLNTDYTALCCQFVTLDIHVIDDHFTGVQIPTAQAQFSSNQPSKHR